MPPSTLNSLPFTDEMTNKMPYRRESEHRKDSPVATETSAQLQNRENYHRSRRQGARRASCTGIEWLGQAVLPGHIAPDIVPVDNPCHTAESLLHRTVVLT